MKSEKLAEAKRYYMTKIPRPGVGSLDRTCARLYANNPKIRYFLLDVNSGVLLAGHLGCWTDKITALKEAAQRLNTEVLYDAFMKQAFEIQAR